MAEQNPKQLQASDPSRIPGNWIKEFMLQFRLAWRLFWDNRVPWAAKLIPVAAIAYIVSPFDLIPDFALGLGQLDDLAILLIGLRLFIDVCPNLLVKEHRSAFDEIGDLDADLWQAPQETIIDLEPQMPAEENV